MSKVPLLLQIILVFAVTVSSEKEAATCTEINGYKVCRYEGVLVNVTQQASATKLLRASDLDLAAIRPNAFKNLTKLNDLDFSLGNRISDLEGGSFSGLRELKVLDLENNAVALSPNLFGELENLESLHLRSNGIKTIPRDSFAGLAKLRYLFLDSNELKSIDKEMFSGFSSSLISLWMFDNQISRISPGAFEDLSGMLHISLENNTLTTIEPGTFRGLKNMWVLELRDNKLTRVSATDFQGLSSLVRLDLRDNQISTIEEGSFSDLIQLEKLTIRRNKLSHIGSTIFQGLRSLKLLDISDNSISTVDSGAFSGLIAGTAIYLVNNNITELDGNAVGLPANGTINFVFDCVIKACNGSE